MLKVTQFGLTWILNVRLLSDSSSTLSICMVCLDVSSLSVFLTLMNNLVLTVSLTEVTVLLELTTAQTCTEVLPTLLHMLLTTTLPSHG